jgi:hypothetical protein
MGWRGRFRPDRGGSQPTRLTATQTRLRGLKQPSVGLSGPPSRLHRTTRLQPGQTPIKRPREAINRVSEAMSLKWPSNPLGMASQAHQTLVQQPRLASGLSRPLKAFSWPFLGLASASASLGPQTASLTPQSPLSLSLSVSLRPRLLTGRWTWRNFFFFQFPLSQNSPLC